MVDRSTCSPMVMAVKIVGMAGDALATAGNSRRNQAAVCGVMAGAAPFGGMDLARGDKGRGGGSVTADTVRGDGGGGHVFLDLGAVIMGMGIKVRGMAGGARAAIAAVDCGIAMAVDAEDPGAVFGGMAEGTAVLVDSSNSVAGMAGNAKGCVGDRRGMAVGVCGEVGGMTTGAASSLDGRDMLAVHRISQGWGAGVTEVAIVQVNGHWVVGWVAGTDAGRGVGDMT